MISQPQPLGAAMKVYLVSSLVALTLAPLLLARVGFDTWQTLLAVVLIVICTYPTARYFARKEKGLPTIAIFAIAYAMHFAFPFFVRDAVIDLVYGEVKALAPGDVSAALIMAIAGICSLLLGYYKFRSSKGSKALPQATLNLEKRKAILFCFVIGLLLPLLFNLKSVIPQEYQQPLSSILGLLQNQILVVIGVLAWLAYGCSLSRWYRLWLYALVIIASARGISTGMLEEALIPIGVFFISKWLYTRRIAVAPVIITVVMVVFFSPVKGDFRKVVWFGEEGDAAEMSSSAKASLWVDQAAEYWGETLSGSRGIAEGTDSAVARTDFIHQLAHIYSLTPGTVPYKYGETYSYFAIAVIPRAIWPDKPEVGSANNYYAVTYGITTEEGIKTATFGVSILGEAFINFGWFGVVFIMGLLGVIIAMLEHVFGGLKSGAGGRAVFVAFFVFFLNGIGSSTEIMFGGILQNLVCGSALLWWARQSTPHHVDVDTGWSSAAVPRTSRIRA
jgi:hypothetical protein